MDKGSEAFRTITEVAETLDLPQHVLRFWETRFTQIRPLKRAGGRRYYRPEDVQLIVTMGCGEACPFVPGLRRIDWDRPDPHGQAPDRVRAIRDETRSCVRRLLAAEGWA